MILVLKKITCVIAVLFFVFSLIASAAEELFVYGKDDIEHICQALDMDAYEIAKYCEENNVKYLAVNADNTKMIKRVETADDFSKRIVDLSVLTDENIETLSYELSHFSEANGQIVKRDGFKLLKYELKTSDDKYYLTTYITVKNSKRITLSFYTDINADRDYIETAFAEQFKQQTDYKPFVIFGVAIFGIIGLVTLALVIKDFLRK